MITSWQAFDEHISIQKITIELDELTNKKLLPMLMFYPMKYEDLPKNAANPEKLREAFIAEVKSLPGILDRLNKTGELTHTQVDTIINVFVRIANQTISKTKITSLKGDETAMSEVAKLETIKVRDFYAELEESETNGVIKILRVLKDRGQSSEQLKSVAIDAGLSEMESNKIIKKISKAKQKKQKVVSKDTGLPK